MLPLCIKYLFIVTIDDLLIDNPLLVTLSPQVSPQVTMSCASVEATDDLILENDEEYPFTIRTSDSSVAQILPDSGRIFVEDNDREFQMGLKFSLACNSETSDKGKPKVS